MQFLNDARKASGFPQSFQLCLSQFSSPELNHKFGIEGNLLSWLTDYLNYRSQITVVNSSQSDELNVTCGIPQGLFLGTCLLSLYTHASECGSWNPIPARWRLDNLQYWINR